MSNEGLAEFIAQHILDNKEKIDSGVLSYAHLMRLIEKPYILFELNKTDWNISLSAESLMISTITLRRKINYLGIHRKPRESDRLKSFEIIKKLVGNHGMSHRDISQRIDSVVDNQSKIILRNLTSRSIYHNKLFNLLKEVEASNDNKQQREA